MGDNVTAVYRHPVSGERFVISASGVRNLPALAVNLDTGLVERWRAENAAPWVGEVLGLTAVQAGASAPQVLTGEAATPIMSQGADAGMVVSNPVGLPTTGDRFIAVVARWPFGTTYTGAGFGTNVNDRAFTLCTDPEGFLILDVFNDRIVGPDVGGAWAVLFGAYTQATGICEFWVNNVSYGTTFASGATSKPALNTGTAKVNFGVTFSGISTELQWGEFSIRNRVLNATERAVLYGQLVSKYVTDIRDPIAANISIVSTGSNILTFQFDQDERGLFDWGVYPAAATPTKAEIGAGTGAAASGAAVVNEGGGTAIQVLVSGLSPGTSYKVHGFPEDAALNEGGVVVSGAASTIAADTTAPLLTAPSAAASGTAGATGLVTTDEGNGRLYWVDVAGAAAPKPSALQVEAGQTSTGGVAAFASSLAVTSVGAKSCTSFGLTAGSPYTRFYMHKDAAGNRSLVTNGQSYTTQSGAGGGVAPIHYAYMGKWALIPNIVASEYPILSNNKTATPANLASVVAGAVSGDVIRLADGDYGDFEIFNRTWSATNKVTLASTTFGGASFNLLGVSDVTGLRLHGLYARQNYQLHRFINLDWTWCQGVRATVGWKKRTGVLTYSTPADTAVGASTNLLMEKCSFIGNLQIITAGGQFTNTVYFSRVKGFEIKNVLIAKGSGDNLKWRGMVDGTVTETVTYDNRLPTSIAGLHGDEMQADGKNNEVCDNNVFSLCAFVSGEKTPGTEGGQGFFLGGGHDQNAIVCDNVIAHGTLNGSGIQMFGSPAVGGVAKSCSMHGYVRGSTMTARDSLIGHNVDNLVTLINTVAIGNGGNPLNVFQGSQPHLFDSFIPQPQYANLGAKDLIALVQNRYAALP